MTERSRTYSWEDPFALRDTMTGRSGLELMQLMASGEFPPPPIAKTLGFRLVEASRGSAIFECEPAEYHYNPIGIVHAGLAMTLMDSAMGLAFVLGAAPAFTMAAGALVHAILKRARPEWTREYAQSFAAGGLVGEAIIGIVVATLLVTHVLGG